MDINRWTGIGRLTRDANLSYTNGGTAVLTFSIATNKKILRDGKWIDEVYYFDCVMFGKSTESLQKYLTKGKQIGVDGELQQKRWVDKETGGSRNKVQIYANLIQFLGGVYKAETAEPESSFVDDGVPF